jgi:RNA polymerase sigma factor (sigma-70 family)
MDNAARFRALFESHHAAVRRYAHHRAIRGPDVDDLVSETFTVAWRRLDVVPTDDPLPWLLAVAANVRRNQTRSARRYEAALVKLPPPQTAPPPPEPDDAAATLRRALGALAPDDQEILRLVAWDGLTPRQAAVVLGCPDGTARARLHRARRRLAARLEAEEGGQPANGRLGQRTPPAGQFVGEGPSPEEDTHEQVG